MMLNANESSTVDVPGEEEGLSKLVGLLDLSTKLLNLLMCVSELSF